ncbi:MAG TPA: cache domain-containing protein [Thermoanaerobaculia bacterium]|nr:cache domain-containing protein [Thermoanaerobaculia bacterium]
MDPAPKPRRFVPRLPARLPMVTLAVLAVLAGAYYFVYVDGKRSYLIEWSFRRLGAMSDRVEARLASYRQVVGNVAERSDDAEASIARAAPLELAAPPVAHQRTKDDPPEVVTAVRTALTGGVPWVHLSAMAPKGFDVTARLRVRDLVAPALDREGFDKLLFASAEDGRVLYQQGRSDVALTSLAGLKRADGTEIDLATLARSTGLFDVDISGRKFRLFVEPCSITPGDAAPGGKAPAAQGFILAGLVRSDRLTLESLKISSSLIVILASLFLLAALAFPFLKLLYMGTGERFRAIDGLLVSLCALVGIAVLCLVLLDAMAYRRLSQEANAQLEDLGTRFRDSFLAEVDDARIQLADLNRQALTEVPWTLAGPEALSARAPETPLEEPRRSFAPEEGRYPGFDTFFWVNDRGWQAIKWTTRDQETPSINVRDRPYFQNVVQGRLWNWNGGRFTLEAIRSWTTGEGLFVVAMPVEDGRARPAGPALAAGPPAEAPAPDLVQAKPVVAALTIPMASLREPVLPPGFGFALVDDDGRVLAHSDAKKGLQENLLEETDFNRALRSSLFARRSGYIEVRYAGREHMLHPVPVAAGLPWSVVAFRDKTLLRTVNVQILTTALLCLVFYVAAILLLLALVYLLPHFRARWVWPARERRGTYAQLAALYTLCLLVYPFALATSDPSHLFWTGTLLPLLVLLVSYVKLSKNGGALAPRHWAAAGLAALLLALLLVLVWARLSGVSLAVLIGSLTAGGALLFLPAADRFFARLAGLPPRLAYVTAAALLLAVLAILPAVSFFKLAYDLHVENMIKHGQVRMMRGVEERMQKGLPADPRHGVYLASFFGTQVPQGGPANRGHVHVHDRWLPDLLEDYLPLYNESSAEMGRLSRDAADDQGWHWEHDGGRLVLHTGHGKGEKGVHLASFVPSILSSLTDWTVLSVSVVILGLAMVGVIWFLVRKILLLRTHVPFWIDRLDLAAGPLGGSVIRISRRRDRLRVPDRPDTAVIDLAAAQQAVEAGTALDDPALEGKRLVFVDHFEHRLRDAGFNRAKRLLLEDLVADPERRVVVLSAVDPHLCLVAGSPYGGIKAAVGEGEREAWGSLLGEFETFDLDGAGDPAELFAALAVLEEDLLKNPPGAAWIEQEAWRYQVRSCLAAVRTECGVTAPLQAIGRELLPALDLREMDRGQILDEIRERAGLYYRALWASLSDGEKLLLVHLAEEGLVNPKNRRPLQRLLARGIARRDPALRVMNETFRSFVIAHKHEVLAIERQEAADSPWAHLKRPLATVLMGVAVFFFATQREVFNTTLVFVTALAGALPQLLQLVGVFGSSKTRAEG